MRGSRNGRHEKAILDTRVSSAGKKANRFYEAKHPIDRCQVLSDVTYHIDHCDIASLCNPGFDVVRVRNSVFFFSSVSVIKLVGGHVYKT